jgi:hypothetical protein
MVLFHEDANDNGVDTINNNVLSDHYVPADTEKKQVILGYLFI